MRIVYFFSQLESYRSLKEALKNGMAGKQAKVIKDFRCDCDQHKELHLKALVTEDAEEIKIKKCNWQAKDCGRDAINSEGKLLMAAYRFYSHHPEWKVRAAVAIGLGKHNTEKSIKLLSLLLADPHYGVVHAAVQALETVGSKQVINLLEEFSTNTDEKRIKKLIVQAIERMKFGVNPSKHIKHMLYKLQNKNLLRKVSSKKEKGNNLLISRKVFQRFFMEISLQKQLEHWDGTSRRVKTPDGVVMLSNKKLLIKSERVSSKKTQKNKINYMVGMFLRRRFLVEDIENNLDPKSGEIYWAVADTADPKITRPVLVIRPINQKIGDFLVVPLTSDIISNSSGSLIVEIKDKKSRIQLFRKKILHRSLLINKYGSISQDNMKEVFKQLSVMPESFSSKRYTFARTGRFKKIRENRYGELYNDSPTPKVSVFNETKDDEKLKIKPITVFDFFKPEQAQFFSIKSKNLPARNQTQSSTRKKAEKKHTQPKPSVPPTKIIWGAGASPQTQQPKSKRAKALTKGNDKHTEACRFFNGKPNSCNKGDKCGFDHAAQFNK